MAGVTNRLVARLDNVGDVLLAGPAVRAVAAAGSPPTFLAGPNGADAVALLPCVGAVLGGWSYDLCVGHRFEKC